MLGSGTGYGISKLGQAFEDPLPPLFIPLTTCSEPTWKIFDFKNEQKNRL
jgi:hypothetical protein